MSAAGRTYKTACESPTERPIVTPDMGNAARQFLGWSPASSLGLVARLLTASLVRVHRGEGIVRHVLLTASPVRAHRGKGIVRNVVSVRSVWFY